jgi:hypothetical protein
MQLLSRAACVFGREAFLSLWEFYNEKELLGGDSQLTLR